MKRLLLTAWLIAVLLGTTACSEEEDPPDDWEENMKDLPSDFNEKLYGSETPQESDLTQEG